MKLILSVGFAFILLINLTTQLLKLGLFLVFTHRTARLVLATLLVWGITLAFILYSFKQTEIRKQTLLAEEQIRHLRIQSEIAFWENYFKVLPTTQVADRLSTLFQAINDQEKADFYRQSSQSLFPPTQ